MTKKIKVSLIIVASTVIGLILIVGLLYSVLLASVTPRAVPASTETRHNQLAKNMLLLEDSRITQGLSWKTEHKEIEGDCRQYGDSREIYSCNFKRVVLFDLSGDSLSNMQQLSKIIYDNDWIADAGNERFFSTYEEYYINKNPESYNPLEGSGTYGENKSYEYSEPSHLSYTKSGELLWADVRIISGDVLEPNEASGEVTYTQQFEDQIKGISRDKYKIKLTLEYRHSGSF